MTTFILAWDGGDAGYAPSKLTADIEATVRGEVVSGTWSVGSRRSGMDPGDRVFLLRQGDARGIIASGRLYDGEIFPGPHWADPEKTAYYTRVDFDHVLATGERLLIETLFSEIPGHHWNNILGSGQMVAPPSDEQLDLVWSDHLKSVDPAVSADWHVAPGDILSRDERSLRYGGATQGGIQPSSSTPNVFIYSDPGAGSTYGYNFDGWTSDGSAFLYTGEGRTGDQRMRVGNAAILNHRNVGRSLRLFVAEGLAAGTRTKVQLYVGEFETDSSSPYRVAVAPDQDGAERNVFVFRLLPVGEVHRREEDASSSDDAPDGARSERVPVDSATPAVGSAEAVPVEAMGTGEYPTAGSTAATGVKREAQLVDRFKAHLELKRSTCIRYKIRPAGEFRDLYTDIFDETDNVLYEAKGVATREAVRMAIGQLLDYRRYVHSDPALAVLLPTRPSEDLIDLLASQGIRCVFEGGSGGFSDAR